jgi:hypothetical protein
LDVCKEFVDKMVSSEPMKYDELIANDAVPGFTDAATKFKEQYEPETKCALAEVYEVTSMQIS